MLIWNSDGDTPEKQVEQILAITPILPGQKPTQKNQIPPSHQATENSAAAAAHPPPSTSENHPPSSEPLPVSENHPPQAPTSSSGNAQPSPLPATKASPSSPPKPATNDLSEPPRPVLPTLPSDLQAAQTENEGRRQRDLEMSLLATGRREEKGGLVDFHEGMRKGLPSGGGMVGDGEKGDERVGLKRMDTEESLDEFVDAEG